MRYAVVIEKGDGNYAAYVPDLPGCVATGATIQETEREIQQAIRFHLDGLRADGSLRACPEFSSKEKVSEAREGKTGKDLNQEKWNIKI